MNPNQLEIMAPAEAGAVALQPPRNALQLLDAVITGGITKENVEVIAQLRQMAKEERDDAAKIAFGKALFQLRKTMPQVYCDKQGPDSSFVYCSEEEISKMIEPHLLAHGFCTLFGQEKEGELVKVSLTLIHEAGHQETRSYTVRPGIGNRMKDNTQVDTSAATSAWRHLVQKMFGLKSRISTDQDAKNMGEYISEQQAAELEHRLKMINGDVKKFLALAEADSFKTIYAMKHKLLDQFLRIKEQAGK